ncbi:hypothetical protein BT67DRAFT_458506 [Trichocladium antarcticum]|uniref:Ribosomal RNA-processing protein 8 n=1 Tax=Trichocladium antarcticum TaxID=1450529 RepID=A0AAN6UD05_9PEZI|nr:hypothetical protein BT67DRAFT_458506 [Trichocladium antarcticum]
MELVLPRMIPQTTSANMKTIRRPPHSYDSDDDYDVDSDSDDARSIASSVYSQASFIPADFFALNPHLTNARGVHNPGTALYQIYHTSAIFGSIAFKCSTAEFETPEAEGDDSNTVPRDSYNVCNPSLRCLPTLRPKPPTNLRGLSISAEKLKVEAGLAPIAAPTHGRIAAPKAAKKRKRPGNAQNTVTAENLSDLWQKVIEHKETPQPKKDNKRQKTGPVVPPVVAPAPPTNLTPEEQEKFLATRAKKKERRERKKEERKLEAATAKPTEEDEEGEEWGGLDDDENPPKAAKPAKGEKADKKKPKGETAPTPTAPTPPAAKLTPLQASMREKLISARFRHLNETLYTRPSADAFQLFQDSPEMFSEYHEGFRRQVDVWPENPVDGYIADIKARAKVRQPPRNRILNGKPILPAHLPLPWPHTAKTCTIADLGCGDAKLATALQPFKQKLHLDIRSYDLQTGGSPFVTRADIANLPLADGSVDVAIFCLALMGTNWTDFVEEAYRILRWKGELWVAEIKSRFAGAATNNSSSSNGSNGSNGPPKRGGVVSHSVGNRQKTATAGPAGKKPKAGGAGAGEDEDANNAELAVQVDGAAALRKAETDISAFVEALWKRGFLLNRDLGDNAVDMGNKMFVRMHFVKAAPAVKGKCAAEGGVEGRAKDERGGGRAANKKKFIGGGEEEDGEAEARKEARLLKPCVYKLR